MVCGAIGIIGIAYWLGLGERRRLHTELSATVGAAAVAGVQPESDDSNPAIVSGTQPKPEKYFAFNLTLTAVVMVCVVRGVLPLAILFMAGFAVALLVNFPKLAAQRELLRTHALNVVNVAVLLLGAAVFTGVLSGTGMVEAMALALMKAVPTSLGPYLATVTAIVAMPLTFFMSNDAYYFGVLPVIAQTATNYGIPAVEVARASLLGGPVHGLSPLLAAMYLLCAMLNVEPGAFQRYAMKWAVILCLLMAVAALISGAITFRH
jgi:CitMHS family citrate-Mg2+:H+ or citrate-Ca2+:H+ symporter